MVLTGGGARLPGLAEAIAAQTGRAPVVPQRPDQDLAEGVLHAIADAGTAGPSTPTVAAPRVRLGVRQTVAPLALFAASLAVLIQTLSAADTYRQVAQTQVVANSAGFSIAALCAMLAALAAAHMVTTGGAVVDAAGPAPPPARWSARLVGKSYTGAAAIGIVIAAIYGLLAGAYFGLTDNPYLRWSLLSALPVAAHCRGDRPAGDPASRPDRCPTGCGRYANPSTPSSSPRSAS